MKPYMIYFAILAIVLTIADCRLRSRVNSSSSPTFTSTGGTPTNIKKICCEHKNGKHSKTLPSACDGKHVSKENCKKLTTLGGNGTTDPNAIVQTGGNGTTDPNAIVKTGGNGRRRVHRKKY